MNASTDPTPGYMLRGYQLEKILETGKLATIYLARTGELWLPPEITIMFLHIPTTLSAHARQQFTERFTRQAKLLIKLRHLSLHPLFGYGEEAGQFYLLFPSLAPATTLARQLQRQKHWSPSEAFAILAPLSSAFDYIHSEGLAYQFFTPGNILLRTNVAPQITGMGLLQLLLLQGLDEEIDKSESHRHLKNIINDYMSLPAYLAPEVVRGEPISTRSDIYSLGIILFELLSGKPPFVGKTYMDVAWKHIREPLPSLHAVAPSIPIAVELIVNQALHRNPEHRFATADEFITAFSHVLNERLRSPVYLSHAKEISPKQASPLLTPVVNEQHVMHTSLRSETGLSKEGGPHNATPHTSEFSLFPTDGKTRISDTGILTTATQPSIELSPADHIHKMTHHIKENTING